MNRHVTMKTSVMLLFTLLLKCSFAQDLVTIREDCGCEPDAAVSGGSVHEAYVFKNDYFVVYDIRKSHREIIESQRKIKEVWNKLEWPVDAGFSTNKHHVLIKDREYFIYDFDKAFIATGNTSDWKGFPESVNAAESWFPKDKYNNETDLTINVRIYTDESIVFCIVKNVHSNATTTFNVSCFHNDKSKETVEMIDDMDGLLGDPIAAVTNLLEGTRILFGADSFCIEVPGSYCDPSCNPAMFRCPKLSFWCNNFVIFAAIPLAFVELSFGIWLWLQKGAKQPN
ncbi:hypothetical protein B4U80_12756 [Leptotrombidium deliense]|uniref:Uncharacterized protein n=1 Tax=Leptotrombidium deliense TaxID=299467 RepID=A0A443SNB2_9ACAR|nr:hypothetical protein B4U80_12756 [Leptotrombidium deliense]